MGASIVLADDETDLRSLYSECLRADGHEVWEAADGAEALALIAQHQPLLLLLDVWMPVLNGFEVLDRLRDNPAATGMKVVMLSNLDDSDTRLESFSAGVCDYWTKALTLAELREGVRSILAEPELASELG